MKKLFAVIVAVVLFAGLFGMSASALENRDISLYDGGIEPTPEPCPEIIEIICECGETEVYVENIIEFSDWPSLEKIENLLIAILVMVILLALIGLALLGLFVYKLFFRVNRPKYC